MREGGREGGREGRREGWRAYLIPTCVALPEKEVEEEGEDRFLVPSLLPSLLLRQQYVGSRSKRRGRGRG